MQLTIDTERDTFDIALKALLGAYGKGSEQSECSPATETPLSTANVQLGQMSGGWDERLLRRWALDLSSDAKEVVRFVAAQAPSVAYDDVAAHLSKVIGKSVDGKYLGGVMSSGGFALRNVAMKDQPIGRNHSRRRYEIDPRIASVLADELGPPQQV